jgi:hypothetical protein
MNVIETAKIMAASTSVRDPLPALTGRIVERYGIERIIPI